MAVTHEVISLDLVLGGFDFDSDFCQQSKQSRYSRFPSEKKVSQEELQEWEEANDEQFAFGINFFWAIDGNQIFLDTNSGIEFWTWTTDAPTAKGHS